MRASIITLTWLRRIVAEGNFNPRIARARAAAFNAGIKLKFAHTSFRRASHFLSHHMWTEIIITRLINTTSVKIHRMQTVSIIPREGGANICMSQRMKIHLYSDASRYHCYQPSHETFLSHQRVKELSRKNKLDRRYGMHF
jgi:hypothetical protein